jgi:hypothetical protein
MMLVAIAGDKFVVPGAGEAYDVRASGPNRKSWTLRTVSRNNRFVQTMETEDASPTPKGLV